MRTIKWDIKLALEQVCFPLAGRGNAYAFVYLCTPGMLTSSGAVGVCERGCAASHVGGG